MARRRDGLLGRASGVTLCNVAGMGLAFLAQMMLARFLGAEGFGRYAFALNWVFLGVMLVKLGLGSVIVRFVATYVTQEAWGLLRGLLRRTLMLQLALALGVGSLLMLLAMVLPQTPSGWTAGTLMLSGLLLPLLVASQWVRDTFYGFQQPVRALVSDVLLQKGLLALLAGAAVLGGLGLSATPELAMLWTALAAVSAVLVGALLLKRALPAARRTQPPSYASAGWLGMGFPMLVVDAATQVTTRGDMLVLGWLAPASEAGIYAAAVALSSLVGVFQGVAVTTLSPVFAAHHARGEGAEMQALLTRGARLVTLLTLPMVGAMVVFGGYLINLYGPEFEGGFHLLIMLAFGHLITAGTGVVGAVLTMTGQQALFAAITVGTATVNTILNIMLVGVWGVEGAAWATLVTTVLRMGTLGWAVYKRLGLMPTLFHAPTEASAEGRLDTAGGRTGGHCATDCPDVIHSPAEQPVTDRA